MKKIFVLMGLAAGLALTSCSDFLDTNPSVQLPEGESVTSETDLQNAVNGVPFILIDYSNDVRMTYTSEFGLYADLLTNTVKIIKDQGQSSAITKYTLTANDNMPDAGYRYFYKALGTVNKTLASVPQVQGNADNINNLKGQLLAWRGLLHFDLARMYCRIPTTVSDRQAANSGLVLADKVFPSDYKGKRTTLKETYEFIIKDLTDALPLLSKGKELGAINYYGALALRARAYLYFGDNANALKDAKEVIDATVDNNGVKNKVYKLYTIGDYATVWDKEGTSESIFEILTNDKHNNQRNSLGFYTSPNGYPECGMNPESKLFKYLTDAANKDVRGQLIADYTSLKNYAGYYPAKYPGRNGSTYINNAKVVRLSELYLIAAEASFHLTGGNAAAPFINELRKNRISDYTDVESVTIDDILFEYEKEFFAENQIAFAYWRNNKSVTNALGKEIAPTDTRVVMPIPQREIDFSGKDVLIQNSGY